MCESSVLCRIRSKRFATVPLSSEFGIRNCSRHAPVATPPTLTLTHPLRREIGTENALHREFLVNNTDTHDKQRIDRYSDSMIGSRSAANNKNQLKRQRQQSIECDMRTKRVHSATANVDSHTPRIKGDSSRVDANAGE